MSDSNRCCLQPRQQYNQADSYETCCLQNRFPKDFSCCSNSLSLQKCCLNLVVLLCGHDLGLIRYDVCSGVLGFIGVLLHRELFICSHILIAWILTFFLVGVLSHLLLGMCWQFKGANFLQGHSAMKNVCRVRSLLLVLSQFWLAYALKCGLSILILEKHAWPRMLLLYME